MIRTLFVITFLLGMAYTVHGQKDKVLRGFSELNAKNYGLALKIFHELKDNNPSISNYGMALLYGETLDFKQIDSLAKVEPGSSEGLKIDPSLIRDRLSKLENEIPLQFEKIFAFFKSERNAKTKRNLREKC